MHLNEAVKRNWRRFPEDFAFRLTQQEKSEVIATCDNLRKLKYSPTLPYAFTEHGVAMLSSVLNSERAIKANISIMRAFIKLRRALAASPSLAARMRQVEDRLGGHDQLLREVFDDIRRLMEPAPVRKVRRRRRARLVQVVTTVHP